MQEKLIEATKEELETLTGIIYGIRNNYDNKFYIGKTKHSFNDRYGGGNWRKNTSNILLKRVVQSHPDQSFSIFIFKNGLKTDEELNFYEIFYAKQLNCYAPNGYNVRECGQRGEYYGDEFKEKVELGKIKRRKIYKIKKINTGEIIEIAYLREWCKNNNLNEMAIRNLFCNITLTSQGYTLPETTKEQIWNSIHCGSKKYKIKNIITKEIIEFENVALFCKENNFCENSFRCMLCGANKQSFGYCLPNYNHKYYICTLISNKKQFNFIYYNKVDFYQKLKQYSNYKVIQIQEME